MTALRNRIPEDELAEREAHPELAPWSGLESLLAALIDEVRNFAWMFAQSRTEDRVPRPERVRRPGVGRSVRARRKMSIEDAMRIDPRLRGLSPEEAQERLDELTGRNRG